MKALRTCFASIVTVTAASFVLSCGDGDGDGSRTVISASGDIEASVEEFRAMLGGEDNGGVPGFRCCGRREINWDGVPDDLAAPNFLPGDYFDDDEAPRARGILLDTPGDGVQVSADGDNPTATAVRFGNINPIYIENFTTYSPERLFSPIGSNVVDLTFVVPGSDAPATVAAFGAVYTGVAVEDGSSFEFFDVDDESLGKFSVPVSEDGLSFLGVIFTRSEVKRVRITYGTTPLGPDEGADNDAAVMDDFIYSEPEIIGCNSFVAPCP